MMKKAIIIWILVFALALTACNGVAGGGGKDADDEKSYTQEDLIGTWELPITFSVEELFGAPLLDAEVTLKALVIFYDDGELWMGFDADSIEDNREALTDAMDAELEAAAAEAGITKEELVAATVGEGVSVDVYISETLDYYFAELEAQLPYREEERMYEVAGNRLIIMDYGDYSYADEGPQTVVDARFEFRIQGDTLVLEDCDSPSFAAYLGIELPVSLTKISDETPS